MLKTLLQVKYLTRPALVLMVAALCVAVAYAVTVGWFAGHRIPTQHVRVRITMRRAPSMLYLSEMKCSLRSSISLHPSAHATDT